MRKGEREGEMRNRLGFPWPIILAASTPLVVIEYEEA